MRLGVSYNYFNGEEHFLKSLEHIRPLVDFVSVVWQERSNSGELITEAARCVLDEAASKSLVDHIALYKPDLTIPRRQNEKAKREIGLSLARKSGSTHFLSLDTDEFYRPEEFAASKHSIIKNGWKSTSVSTFLHIKRPIYRALDSTNCCFITEIGENTQIGVKDFPCEMVDSTRRMTAQPETHHHFPINVIAMYHMNTVRRDFAQKIRNSSTTDLAFLDEVQRALGDWSPGEVFEFPRKGCLKVDRVDNEFNTYDPGE